MIRLARGDRLVVASHNRGKVREIHELLAPYDLQAIGAAELGLPEPEETETTFAGNAVLKADAASKASGLPALSDDSGFCVAALDGAPGVMSARWAGPEKDFSRAMADVHAKMGEAAAPGAGGATDPRAWFIAALCLAWPDGHTETFLGRIDGTVVWPPRGAHGFGYDPMFLPAGGTQTFGEMDPAAKHALSHRARAFAQIIAACFG